jgi:GDP-fucose protein O-fucosyltransferase
MGKLFYQLYNPTGLVNQVMSIELAVGLSHVTARDLVIHYMNNSGDQLYNYQKVPIYTPSRWHNKQREHMMDETHFPHLKDLLDFEGSKNFTLIDEKINYFPQEDEVLDFFAHNYYYSDKDMSDDELIFADGRNRLDFDNSKNYHLKMTLGWYSRFFYKRDKELDRKLSSVKFKKEYQDLAEKISKDLGKFSGAHLRLTDHVKMFNTTEEMFESGLKRLESLSLPIVLSTDEPNHPMVLKNKHRLIMLDELIVNNYKKEFMELPYQDEVVFGIICNLVMQKSYFFIGTSGSTYTAYIQRNRNQNNLLENWDFFDEPDKYFEGPYTWNNYNLDRSRKMWWREWEESKLDI